MKDKDIKKDEGVENVVLVDIVPEMRESYLDYAMSFIVSRALPDVRDGLKPVHRRILYDMHELGLVHTARFRKSAMVVGDVIAKYHPHGESAVYDSLVRMAQDFTTRYPLVSPQGNFGSLDGDPPAAYRYTEAKLSRIASEMVRDLEKDTVEWKPNYDTTRREPWVLPALLPNLLLNGTLGIAVGMATKIPPHNLREIVDALVHLAEHPKADTEDLLAHIKGPDFPTGGIIYNARDIRHAYTHGRGGVVLRGEAEIVEDEKESSIVITSIPYQVNKAELIMKMADLVREKKIDGIRDLRDESTKDVRIVVELKHGSYPEKILNFLYKHTDLETVFHFNMLALSGGVPKLLSLRDILEEFVEHRRLIVTRRTRYDLARAEERAHILEGLKIALDDIDAVIKTIKSSRDTEDAKKNLIAKFKLSDIQAVAILEMKLSKLAGLERKRVEDELKEKKTLIKELKSILADPKKVVQIVINEFRRLREEYGDDRRTRVVAHEAKAISLEDTVPDVENVLVLTQGGYVKRTDPKEFRLQRRGGVGVSDLSTREEDFVRIFLTASTHCDLLFFTDRGKVYQMKFYDIPEGKRATRGKAIVNFLSIATGERVTSVLPVPKTSRGANSAALMVTRRGVVKKVLMESFKDVRRSGIIAISLSSGDELLAVRVVEKGDDVLLATQHGQSIRFSESNIRAMGRTASGVTGMKLSSSDAIVGAVVSPHTGGGKEMSLLVVSEQGFGKRTRIKEYRLQRRGGSGVKTFKVTTKTGKVIAARALHGSDGELLAISRQGVAIKIPLAQIPLQGRQTQGVRVMRPRAGDALASVACLDEVL